MTMILPPNAPPQAPAAAEPQYPDLFAALLSYVVPGLGQLYQGRLFKGLLFFFSIYALFFYGMYLGKWSNVYFSDTSQEGPALRLPRWAKNLYNRPQFAAQFWVGAAAWPALLHYWRDEPRINRGPIDTWPDFRAKFQAAPSEFELNDLQRNSDKHWDLGWVYTVIAGVLNVLIIYDALAGPAFGPSERHVDGSKS